MSTNIRIINFGPRPVKVSIMDPRQIAVDVPMETLYLHGVSTELCVHDSASVLVEELAEPRATGIDGWPEPVPLREVLGDPLIAEAVTKIESGELQPS